ncbi:acyl-CoA thioesterase [Calidifontibacillus oryziterrae]|uniref:acyl-CoA thioesterase n=1 Tax=Calidifontibacillus oryziterrae TaxID=1191699 RepID=UPI00030C3EE7|nr:thioesterase family protein [Calidifontibacillus oryziterrae]
MRKNSFEIRVNWGDTDKAGIVYYPNYFKWFDIAGHQFFRSIGLSPATLEEEKGIILPLLDAKCSFEKPLYYDDIITIQTEVAEIHNKVVKLNHAVYRGSDKTGYGYEVRGWVKKSDGTYKAVPIPDDVVSILKEDCANDVSGLNPLLNA